MSEVLQPQIDDQEVSLKEMILIFKDYLLEGVRKWYWVLLSLVLFNAGFIAKYYFKESIEYEGELKVMLNTNSGSSLLGSLTGSLGLGSFGGNDDAMALDKVTLIMQSRDIMSQVLLSQTSLPAQKGIMGNYFLDSLGIRDGWQKSKEARLRNFKTFTSTNKDSCTADEWRAIQAMSDYILKNLIEFKSSEVGVLTVTFKHTNEQLACEFLNIMYEYTDRYYMVNQVDAESSTFKLLQKRRDSINNALSGAISSVARYRDGNRGTLFATEQVPLVKGEQDIQFLGIMKAEITKNYEVAKMSLDGKQPYIRAIDLPRTPLPPIIPSLGNNVKKATGLGIALSWILLMILKAFRAIME
jgi:hypothetical protein